MINTINEIMYRRGIGVVYLDESANILEKNAMADDILNSTPRLSCQGRSLLIEDKALNNRLKDFMIRARSESNVASFYLKKSVDEAPISLKVFPVKDDLISKKGEKSKWLILVRDTQKKPIFSADSMAAFYELTKAEIRREN